MTRLLARIVAIAAVSLFAHPNGVADEPAAPCTPGGVSVIRFTVQIDAEYLRSRILEEVPGQIREHVHIDTNGPGSPYYGCDAVLTYKSLVVEWRQGALHWDLRYDVRSEGNVHDGKVFTCSKAQWWFPAPDVAPEQTPVALIQGTTAFTGVSPTWEPIIKTTFGDVVAERDWKAKMPYCVAFPIYGDRDLRPYVGGFLKSAVEKRIGGIDAKILSHPAVASFSARLKKAWSEMQEPRQLGPIALPIPADPAGKILAPWLVMAPITDSGHIGSSTVTRGPVDGFIVSFFAKPRIVVATEKPAWTAVDLGKPTLTAPQGVGYCLSFTTSIPYKTAEEALTKAVVGKRFYSDDGTLSVVVKSASLQKRGKNLVIESEVEGPIKASVSVVGKVTFDPSRQEFAFKPITYEFEPRWLRDAGYSDWLAAPLRWEASDWLRTIREVFGYATNASVAKGVSLVGDVLVPLTPISISEDQNSFEVAWIASGEQVVRIGAEAAGP